MKSEKDCTLLDVRFEPNNTIKLHASKSFTVVYSGRKIWWILDVRLLQAVSHFAGGCLIAITGCPRL